MADGKEYQKYGAVLALSILAVSATYLFTFAGRLAWGSLVLIPLSFGYTAYISRTSFEPASLAALGALAFIPVNNIVAAAAVAVAVGNISISVFAGGERFRDFYASTRVPLIIVGIAMGSLLFYSAYQNPAVADNLRSSAAEFSGSQAETVLNQSNLIEAQKKAQETVVRQTSLATVSTTSAYVLNDTRQNLTREGALAVRNSFRDARKVVPSRMVSLYQEKLSENATVDMEARTKDVLDARLQGKRLAIVIPLLVVFFASLQPVVGLLTAVFAYMIRSVSGSIE